MAESKIDANPQKVLANENPLSWCYWLGEIDTRWLAIFRILLGLLILKDALYHLPLARIFYSDAGIIPRSELFNGLVRSARFSLMDAIGAPQLATTFFIIWIIVLILLILGYRVRLMTILNFILILSVHERNGYILTAADTLMRAMCFWMMFAPVGQYYSIDAIRRRWRRFRATDDLADLRVESQPRTAFALPMRMIQWQLIIVYCSTAFLKFISPIWTAGEAMHYVTQIRTFALPIGIWMNSWSPEMLAFITHATIIIEIAIPILLIMPLFWRISRGLAFMLAIALHGGIAVGYSIQDFSILMLICYLPFFDPAWLRWLEIIWNRTRDHLMMALPTERFSPRWLILSITRDDELSISQNTQTTETTDSWHIETQPDDMKQGLSAWRAVTPHLPFSRFWDWLLTASLLRHVVWILMRWFVWFSRREPFIAQSISLTQRRQKKLLTVILIPFFVLVILWNIEETGEYTQNGFDYPPPMQAVWDDLRTIVWYSGLWQYWDMFSPTPILYDGWLVIEGQFENGFSYDLFTKQTADYETPTRWYWGPMMKWEKFEENVYRNRYDALLRGWGSYYCRTINDGRIEGTRLATLQITMVYANFHAPNEFPNTYQQDQIWFHWCYDEYAPQS